MTRSQRRRDHRWPPEARVDAGMTERNEMTIGRTDDPENPISVHGFRSRNIVWGWIAEPIWASGHGAASTGRTHDRNRSARQNSHLCSCNGRVKGLNAAPRMAGIAQLAERQVVVLDVTGSSPVARPIQLTAGNPL